MIIDILSLRKICIAEAFVDTELLKSYVANSTLKKVESFLRTLEKKKSENPSMVETDVVNEFNTNNDSRSGKQYLKILLPAAFDRGYLSGNMYDALRAKLIGMKDYDEGTRKKIEERWKHEYRTDPFSMLQGNNNQQTPLAAAAASKTKEK